MFKTNNSYFLKDSNHTLHSSKSDLQEDSTSSDNVIKIPQEELDDIILSLEFTITDINQDQNKYYVIEELENIINKLKKSNFKSKGLRIFGSRRLNPTFPSIRSTHSDK